MTTKTDIEQERRDFEKSMRIGGYKNLDLVKDSYEDQEVDAAWLGWKLRAALQSQGPAEQALAELVDKIVPGLDTGDLLADAQQASAALGLGAPVSQDREHVPAYRPLGAGEIIQADDEFIANDGVTWSSAGTGLWVGMPYTHALKSARRRIEGEENG